MKSMLIVTKNFPPTICGVGDYASILYEKLKSKGYRVMVMTSANPEVVAYVSANGISHDVFPVIKSWDITIFRSLKKILEKQRFDFCCIEYVPHSFSKVGVPFYLIFVLFLLRMHRVKTFVFFHEVSVRIFYSGVKNFGLGIAQRAIALCLYLVSNSSLTSNRFYQKNFFSLPILLNPVPSNIIDDNCLPSEILNGDKLIIGTFVNRCTDTVLSAVAECIYMRSLNIELKILGHATQVIKNNISSVASNLKIGENISWSKSIDKQDLSIDFRSCNVFLHVENVTNGGAGGLTTKSGILSTALAAGLPVIGTFGDMTDLDILMDGKNVLAVNGSTSSITEAILKLATNEVFRMSLGENARRTYEGHLSWKNHLDKFDLLLETSESIAADPVR